jgi:5-methylcytosine-specific restriction protein A
LTDPWHNSAKGRPWLPWYGTQRWRRRAAAQLAREPRCQMCLAEGKVTTARVADHIEDHKGDWHAFWRGELQSLCFAHHNAKTRLTETERRTGRIQLQRGADERGWPLDRRHSWWQEST